MNLKSWYVQYQNLPLYAQDMPNTPEHERSEEHQPHEIIVRKSLFFLFLKFIFMFGFLSVFYFLLFSFFKLIAIDTTSWILLISMRVIELGVGLYVFLDWHYEYYKITGDHIIYNEGVFLIKRRIFSVRNIESVTLRQNIMGRLFRYGDVRLTAPTMQESISLRFIDKPWKYLRVINNMIPKLRSTNVFMKDPV